MAVDGAAPLKATTLGIPKEQAAGPGEGRAHAESTLLLLAIGTVYAYLLLNPWTATIAPSLNGHDYARACEALVFLMSTAWAAHHFWCMAERAPQTPSGFVGRLWSATIVTLAIASVSWAPVTTKALQELTLWIGLATVSFMVACFVQRYGFHGIGRTVITATLVVNVVALLTLCLGMFASHQAPDFDNIDLGYVNRRFFNHVQTVALPLCGMAIHGLSPSRRWAWAGRAAIVSGFALLLFSGGRGTTVGIAGGTILSALWLRRSCLKAITRFVLWGAGGLLAHLVLFVIAPVALDLQPAPALAQRAVESGSVVARLLLWTLCVNSAAESPWVGIGPMHFAHWPNWEAAHPHNIYFQIAAEWGVPMLCMMTAGVIYMLRRLVIAVRNAESSKKRNVGCMLMIACIAALLDGCFSGNFVMPVSQVWIATCVGMGIGFWFIQRGLARSNSPDCITPRSETVIGRRLLAFVLCGAVFIHVTILGHELVVYSALLQRAQELSGNAHTSPRFWSNGWF